MSIFFATLWSFWRWTKTKKPKISTRLSPHLRTTFNELLHFLQLTIFASLLKVSGLVPSQVFLIGKGGSRLRLDPPWLHSKFRSFKNRVDTFQKTEQSCYFAKRENLVKRLWCSWQSGRFWPQRSAVRIHASAKFSLLCQKGQKTEAGNVPFFEEKLCKMWVMALKS